MKISRKYHPPFLFFGYVWKDRNKITTILGIHLILLGLGAFLLVLKALYFGGVYDTWAPGGDVREITNLTLSPGVIFGYLLKSPFGWYFSTKSLANLPQEVFLNTNEFY